MVRLATHYQAELEAFCDLSCFLLPAIMARTDLSVAVLTVGKGPRREQADCQPCRTLTPDSEKSLWKRFEAPAENLTQVRAETDGSANPLPPPKPSNKRTE